MRIDVWSDVVCPWCYLGRKRLEVALADLDFGATVDVHWRAFQLDPTATAEPKDLEAAIDRKYGPGAFTTMTARLGGLGAEVGIDYRFDIAQRVTSRPALSVTAWIEATYGPATADAMHDRLFHAYFTEGANIALDTNLVAWAVGAGADEDLVADAIANGAGETSVAADLAEAAERQITGVPAFVVDGNHMIPGAQDVVTMKALLKRIHVKRST